MLIAHDHRAFLANSSDVKKTAGPKMASSIDSHTPQQLFNMVFWTQVFRTELRFSAKSRRHFLFRYGNIEN